MLRIPNTAFIKTIKFAFNYINEELLFDMGGFRLEARSQGLIYETL